MSNSYIYLDICIGLLGLAYIVFVVYRIESRYKRSMRKTKADIAYRRCVNQINEWNGYPFSFNPTIKRRINGF